MAFTELLLSPMALIATGCVALISYFAWFPTTRWRYRAIPGPFGLPVMGNIFDFMTKDSTKFIMACRAKYGPVYKIWFGCKPWVVVSDPDIGKRLNLKLIQRPPFPHVFVGHDAEIADKGILFARGPMWRRARRAFESSLINTTSLSGYFPIMQEVLDRFLERLDLLVAEKGGAAIDIWHELGNMTLAAVGSCAFGVDFHTLSEGVKGRPLSRGQKLAHGCKVVFAQGSIKAASIYFVLCVIFPYLDSFWKFMANHAPDARHTTHLQSRLVIRDTCAELMKLWEEEERQEKADEAAASAKTNGAASTGNGSASDLEVILDKPVKQRSIKSSSFMAGMLRNRDSKEDDTQEIVAQLLSFILAGYETTANALSYCIYLLATRPEAEEKLADEIRQWYKQNNGAPQSGADLDQFPYADAVLKEALRLYPPGASTIRENQEDLDLGQGLPVIPAKSHMVLPLYNWHHDDKFFPRAEEFLPERWLPGHDDIACTNENAYMPFGSGARMCVGYKFANMEGKLALIRMYQRFTFKLQPGQIPLRTSTGITLAPINGIWVNVEHRI